MSESDLGSKPVAHNDECVISASYWSSEDDVYSRSKIIAIACCERKAKRNRDHSFSNDGLVDIGHK